MTPIRHDDAAKRLLEAINVIRKTDPEMPVQSLATLLLAYCKPGLGQSDLAEWLDVESSTATRIASRLGERERFGSKGLDLVNNEINPQDRRARQLYLTAKGQRFVTNLLEALTRESK